MARTGQLYANSEPTPFYIKGINWKGAETEAALPIGLDKHELGWYLQLLRTHKFNAIRLHFSHQTVLQNEPISVPSDSEMKEWDKIPYIGMLVEFAKAAEELGILIILVSSRLSEDADPGSPEEGMWYNSQINEQQVTESWFALSKMFCDKWNVVGVDLQNGKCSAIKPRSPPIPLGN